jgi:hypothetical protein
MSLQFLKAVANRSTGGIFDKSPVRVDAKVPLGLQIGKYVSVSPDKFYIGDGKFAVTQQKDNMKIEAIGYYHLGEIKYYNIYLSGDRTIQIDSNAQEIMLYQTIMEDSTLSKKDLKNWLDKDTGWLGWKTITANGNEYARLIDQGGADWVNPIEYTQKITNDPFVAEVMRTEHEAMLFGRNIEGTNYVENLIAEKAIDNNGITIACHVGIMLNPLDLNIY